MDTNDVRDIHCVPFVVVPTNISEGDEEYILGYTGDQDDTLFRRNKEIEVKVECDNEADDNKLLLKSIIDDYKSNDDDEDFFKKDHIKKKKKYHIDIDDKKIINHLLSELPKENKPEENKPKETYGSLIVKKEIDDTSNRNILVDLVPQLPRIEINSQNLQKQGSSPVKKLQKNKKNEINSRGSPEVIELEDDSTDTGGNRTAMETEKVPATTHIPFESYFRMITRAILTSPGSCISQKKLFLFISQNYPYYFDKPDGWQAPIEKYLWNSGHFVKVLPKNFVQGSEEVWILNPSTQRNIITRFIRGSSGNNQVNQSGLGSHGNMQHSNSSHIGQLPSANSNKNVHKKNITPDQISENSKQKLLSRVTQDFTTPYNSDACKRTHNQKEASITTRKFAYDSPPLRKPFSPSLLDVMISSKSKFNKTLNAYSTSLDNLISQKIADNGRMRMPVSKSVTANKRSLLRNSNSIGSHNLNLVSNSSALKSLLIHTDKPVNRESVSSHNTAIRDISSEDDDERSICVKSVHSSESTDTCSNSSGTLTALSSDSITWSVKPTKIVSAPDSKTLRDKPKNMVSACESLTQRTRPAIIENITDVTLKGKSTNAVNIPKSSIEVYEISSEDE